MTTIAGAAESFAVVWYPQHIFLSMRIANQALPELRDAIRMRMAQVAPGAICPFSSTEFDG
jgi:hypothetical protein